MPLGDGKVFVKSGMRPAEPPASVNVSFVCSSCNVAFCSCQAVARRPVALAPKLHKCLNLAVPVVFPKPFTVGFSLRKKRLAAICPGILRACPPCARHASAMCPPYVRLGRASKPCPPCVCFGLAFKPCPPCATL